MTMEQKSGVKLPPPNQLGFAVKDLDRAVEYYVSKLGWGPFRIREMEIKGAVFKGKKGDARLKVAIADGAPSIELIQVLEGETPHTEFLRTRGEGIQHLGYRTNDIKGMVARFAAQGIKPVWQLDMEWTSFAYLDTDKTGGVMVEFVQMNQPSKAI